MRVFSTRELKLMKATLAIVTAIALSSSAANQRAVISEVCALEDQTSDTFNHSLAPTKAKGRSGSHKGKVPFHRLG